MAQVTKPLMLDETGEKIAEAIRNFGAPSDAQAEKTIKDWLDDHPEATTTVQDKSLTEEKLTDEFRLRTVNNYVTPEMYGAVCDGVTDDSKALQLACDSGIPVVIDKDIAIASTVEVKTSVEIKANASVNIIADVDGFKMVGTKTLCGNGNINVRVDGYTSSVVLIDAGRYAKVLDVNINGYFYSNQEGVGIKIASDTGNSAYCVVDRTSILGFMYGVYMKKGEYYWNNNHEIKTQTSFCSNSVRVENSHHHRISVYGESGLNKLNNTEVYVENSNYCSFDINLVDTGNPDHNALSIELAGCQFSIVTGSVFASRVGGECAGYFNNYKTTNNRPVPGVYDVFANKDATFTPIGDATLLYTGVFKYPKNKQSTILRYKAVDATQGCEVSIDTKPISDIFCYFSGAQECEKIEVKIDDGDFVIVYPHQGYISLFDYFKWDELIKMSKITFRFLGAKKGGETHLGYLSAALLQYYEQNDDDFAGVRKTGGEMTGDLSFADGKGVVLTDADGKKYRLSVGTDGTLIVNAI